MNLDIFLTIANGLTNGMKTVAISSLANILGLFVLSKISIAGLGAKNVKRYLNDTDKMAWSHRITDGIFITMGLGLLQLKRVQ